MGASYDSLEFRSGYFHDAQAFRALADLLRDTFGIDISALDRLGGPDPTSMPFGYFDNAGRCVANFSSFSMPLIVDGRMVLAAGYQSGAVRPEYRGRGLYRDLMRRAFDWTDKQGFELGILLTDKPDLYRSYGFRTVAQHCFSGKLPPGEGARVCRHLSMENAGDVELIRSILVERMPVSERFAVVGHIAEFLLNACFDPSIRLSHMPGEDAVIAWKQSGSTFELLDVAARRLPALASILSALDVRCEDIRVFFPPDKLGWSGTPVRHQSSCELMVRGEIPSLFHPPALMLSPTAEF